ncbi:alpha/beta hydrolase [Streptomyces sp. PmtG]
MTVRRSLLALALGGALLSSSAAAEAVPEAPRAPVLSYGPHARQTVTVHGAERPGERPALVVLHGGSWARDTDWGGWSRWFAARGFTVYETDYRLSSDAVWSAQRADVLAALRWIARRQGPGAERPLLLGSSAGGHLALSVGAYGDGRAYARGVVALSPVASPYRAWRDGTRPGASAERRSLARAAKRLAGCDPDLGGQALLGAVGRHGGRRARLGRAGRAAVPGALGGRLRAARALRRPRVGAARGRAAGRDRPHASRLGPRRPAPEGAGAHRGRPGVAAGPLSAG